MHTTYNQRQIWLLVLIAINIFVSIVHYTDHIIFFDEYPETSLFTPQITHSLWLVMTPLCIAGYYLYIKRAFLSAYFCLYLYIIMSQITLGQYIITPMWHLSLKMNTLILLESVSAIPLLIFVAWSQLFLKESTVNSQ
ncbi:MULTISPECIES: hypothetical protein [Calothrix]|uniref:Uncharacterized protein n=2 Tax=Calothrix TaxID=1186 RepID=A0ABR8AI23_9CYAN|nr:MULTISPECIES: hypothetical protein [Calothrix]MBD2199671.1 hypothetical protein [Calothrix parietina FACHB-288]MBD2228468.1 hypothetical protein [Calothrix anomala FACHB-343]